MQTVIQWKNAGKWETFPIADLLSYPRQHAVDLFSRSIPAIIKVGERYIVNNTELRDSYKRAKKDVMMLQELQPSDRPFGSVGFLGE